MRFHIKKFFLNILSLLALALLLPLLQGCSNGNARVKTSPASGMHNARLLTIEDLDDGSCRVEIKNPKHPEKLIHSFLLVDSTWNGSKPQDNMEIIRTPVKGLVVHSAVHTSLFEEFGCSSIIKGVFEPQWYKTGTTANRIKNGEITDCGNHCDPNIEQIFMLQPDLVLISDLVDESGFNKMKKAGIPVIQCADYMEETPLGRAEWMRFYGRLAGKKETADSLYNVVENEYRNLSDYAAGLTTKPEVMTGKVYANVWDVPTYNSTMGRLIRDAGGRNPFDSYKEVGSVALSPEKVITTAGFSDIWLLVYFDENQNLTYNSLKAENALYAHFKPFKERKVFATNSSKSTYFSDLPFHPHLILADLVYILHPEETKPGTKRYFISI